MNMQVDLREVEELVKSPDFTTFLIEHTVDISTSAFILQALFERIAYEKEREKRNGYVQ
jgi:hypothetical protein